MADENDEQDQQQTTEFDFEGEQNQEPQVQVQQQEFNGNGVQHAESPTAPSRITPPKTVSPYDEVVTRKFVIPRTGNSLNFGMGTVNRRPIGVEPQKIKTDRDFLDQLSIRPESMNFRFAIHRILPTHVDGEEIPKGKLSDDTPICLYDDLRNEIVEAWGGGKYRCVVVDEQGRFVPGIAQSVMVEIPTTQYKPKFSKYEQVESKSRAIKGLAVVADVDSDELKQMREEEKRAKLQEQRDNEQYLRDARAQKRELEALRQQKELAKLRAEIMNSDKEPPKADPQIQLMMAKMEEDRRRYEEEKRRQDEDRKRLDDERKEEKRRHEEMLDRERQRREDDQKESQRQREEDRRRYEEAQTRMFEKLAERPKDDGVMPILLAMINKEPKQDQTPQLLVEMNKSQTQLMAAAMTPKPTDNSQIEMMMRFALREDPEKLALMKSLMDATLNKKEDLTLDKMMALLKVGKDEAKEYFQLAQGFNPMKDGDDEEGYDPSIGVMGNIFKSLKALAQMAVTSPLLQPVLEKLVGSRNPDDAALANAARMMEMQGYTPQNMLQGPPQQQQLPYMQQPPQQMFPQPSLPQQQGNAYPPLPPQQRKNLAQQQSPTQSNVAQQPGTTNAPPQVQQQLDQQQQVVGEFEGVASGLPSNDGPVEEQQRELSPQEAALLSLKENVTEAVRIMSEEAVSKPNERSWVEFAFAKWHREFLAQLYFLTSEGERWNLIGRACDRTVWDQLMGEVTKQVNNGDSSERLRLGTEMNKLVDMCATLAAQVKAEVMAKQQAAQQPPLPPQQQQATPQQQVNQQSPQPSAPQVTGG